MNLPDPLQALDRLAAQEASRRATERDRIRVEFPAVIEVADMIRATCLDQSSVRLVYAEEGGRTIGKMPAGLELTWHGTHVPKGRK